MTFPKFFIVGMCRSLGWPRKVGPFLRKRMVMPGFVARYVYEQLLQRAFAFGAYEPRTGVRLLVDSYREKNWSESLSLGFFEELEGIWGLRAALERPRTPLVELFLERPGEPMWRAMLEADGFASQMFPHNEMIEPDVFEEHAVLLALHWNFAAAVMFGIDHQGIVRTAIAQHVEEAQQKAEDYGANGLELPPNWEQKGIDGFVADCLALAEAYTRERGQLVQVPPEVLAHPTLRHVLA